MKTLSPSVLFRATEKDLATEHAGNVLTIKFSKLLTYTLAEMATGRDVSPEELRGAKMFIGILLNLSEIPKPPKPVAPDKSLGQLAKK